MEESRRVISLIDLKGGQPREQIFFTATIGKSIGAPPERVSIFAWAKVEPLWGSKSIAPGLSPAAIRQPGVSDANRIQPRRG